MIDHAIMSSPTLNITSLTLSLKGSRSITIGSIGDTAHLDEPDVIQTRCPCPSTSFPGNAQRVGRLPEFRRPSRINDIFVAACDHAEVHLEWKRRRFRESDEFAQDARPSQRSIRYCA